MTGRTPYLARGAGLVLALAAARASAGGPAGVADLHVTLGRIEEVAPGRLLVEAPKVRAVLRDDATWATLRIRYLGPSGTAAPLASGELRRQAGLKLVVQDDCNLVYVMWRASGPRGLAVLLKRNPGARTHAECGARGYRPLVPQREAPVPSLSPGTEHLLEAELDGRTLRVRVDGVVAWVGVLPGDAAALQGPAGLRTDNGRFELGLRAGR